MNEINRQFIPEVASLSPRSAWTRREFVVSGLAAGFALAAQPTSAQTISTDPMGLTAGEVRIPVKGGEIPAYRAMPASGKDLPLILVVQEIFGRSLFIRKRRTPSLPTTGPAIARKRRRTDGKDCRSGSGPIYPARSHCAVSLPCWIAGT